jgi:hypothetical protein
LGRFLGLFLGLLLRRVISSTLPCFTRCGLAYAFFTFDSFYRLGPLQVYFTPSVGKAHRRKGSIKYCSLSKDVKGPGVRTAGHAALLGPDPRGDVGKAKDRASQMEVQLGMPDPSVMGSWLSLGSGGGIVTCTQPTV